MPDLVGKPQVLKEVNSSAIEQFVNERGPLSKPQLAKLSGLSLPTVSKIIDDLVFHGYISEVGLSGKGAGRKAMMYETNRDNGCLVALYYRWEKYFCRITDITGHTLYETTCPLDNSTADAAFISTADAIDGLLRQSPAPVKSVGIGVPGAVLPDGRLSGIPKIAVWEGFNLAEHLAQRYDMDIVVENDVKLSAVGYYYANNLSENCEHLVYIYAGNGMGSGIILNKKLFRGANNFSGELGFMAPLIPDAPHRDYTALGGYLEQQLRQFVNKEREEFNTQPAPEQQQILINLLTGAAANYIVVLNPDAIVFGGEAFNKSLINEIKSHLSMYSFAEILPQILFDEKKNTGVDGLISTCRAGISKRMQLVEDGGV